MVDAVGGVAKWLGGILIAEAKKLYGVKGKVTDLQSQLLWMESFLVDVQESKEYHSLTLRVAVAEIKHLANESRSVIQSYIDKVALASSTEAGWMGKAKTIQPRHEVDSEIDALWHKMSDLRTKMQIFGLAMTSNKKGSKSIDFGGRVEETMASEGEKRKGGGKTQPIEGVNVIGIEKRVGEVVDELLDNGAEKMIVALCGFGGMGKTTLAQAVFWNNGIRKQFDRLSWIDLDYRKEIEFRDVLEELLHELSLENKEQMGKWTDTDLLDQLQQILYHNRCLVVLDGIQKIEYLDYLRPAFFTITKTDSRVLLTTRQLELAESADAKVFHSPKELTDEESWKLFQLKLGWHVSDPEMVKLGLEILKMYRGLPLAIITAANVCKGKKTKQEWEHIHHNISTDRPIVSNLQEILNSSYNSLPNHLKPCLLQLSSFPEDYEIPVSRVLRMWISEGFVSSPNECSTSEESLGNIARNYLSNLVERVMVEVARVGSDQRIEMIRLHDLVREILVEKAKEEGFHNIIDDEVDRSEPSSNRLHRMTFYIRGNSFSSIPASSYTCKDPSQLKSLLVFPLGEHHEGNYDRWLEGVCNEFTRLRVLDLGGFLITGSFPTQIENLMFLRYLSLKGTKITHVPSSVGNLRLLQLLDLRVCFAGKVVSIPDTLSNVTRMVYLFLPAVKYKIAGKKLLQLDTLVYLEILKNLDTTKCQIQDLLRLTKIRRLSLKMSKKDSLKVLMSPAVTSLEHLQRLSVRAEGIVISKKSGIVSHCDRIYRLDVEGRISVPLRDQMFPPCLEVLILESSLLKEDPMLILMWLPNLKRLGLGKDSFLGATMVCSADGFVQLTELKMVSLPNLCKWILEEGALPNLEKLVIDNCDKLTTLPRDYLPSSVEITQNPSDDT